MKQMNLKQYMRIIIGTMVLISALLGFFLSKYWLLFTIFIGINMIQSALTGWCLLEDLLKKAGVKP